MHAHILKEHKYEMTLQDSCRDIIFLWKKISFENKKEMSNLDSKTANYFAKMAKTLLGNFLLN